MSTFIVNDGVYEGNITIPKQTHTIALPTAGTYVNKDININVSVQSANGTIGGTPTSGSATAVLNNVNSVNTISNLTGKTAGQDYWQIKATATATDGAYLPSYTVSSLTAGWVGTSVIAATADTVPVTGDSTGQSVYIPKIVGATTINGTSTFTPTISKQAILTSGVTDAASGNATTEVPSDGVYVAVKSAASTGTITATPSVITAGYGDATYHGIAEGSTTAGALASAVTYIPITTQTPTLSGGGLTDKDLIVGATNVTTSSTNTSGIYISTQAQAGRAAIHYTNNIEGWVSASSLTPPSGGEALAIDTWGAENYYLTGVNLQAPTSGTRSFQITVPNGANDTLTFVFTVDASGNTTVTDS